MSSSESPTVLPIATIQVDFESLVDDVFNGLVPEEKFWLSCYKTGEQSLHGKIHIALNEQDRNVVDYEGLGGVKFGKGADVRELTNFFSLIDALN